MSPYQFDPGKWQLPQTLAEAALLARASRRCALHLVVSVK
jgi:hypothetical protein